jgi:hypothetical protein
MLARPIISERWFSQVGDQYRLGAWNGGGL